MTHIDSILRQFGACPEALSYGRGTRWSTTSGRGMSAFAATGCSGGSGSSLAHRNPKAARSWSCAHAIAPRWR